MTAQVFDEPSLYRIDDVVRAQACAASWPRPGPTSVDDPGQSPSLVRWMAIRDAIEVWHQTQSSDAWSEAMRVFDSLDAVQRAECVGLFKSYTTMIDHDEPIDFAPDPSEVSRSGILLRSRPTAVIRRPERATEYLKFRTGKVGTAAPEAAVLLGGSRDPDSVFADLMLSSNDEVPIEMDDEEQELILTELFGTARDVGSTLPRNRKLTTGYHCYGCGRPAFCGAYPSVDVVPPSSFARLLVVSKSGLARAANCDRRGAWSLVHNLPAEEPTDVQARSFGLLAHEVLEELVQSENPEDVLQHYLDQVPGFLKTDLETCIRNHLSIDREHSRGPIAIKGKGVQTGITFNVDSSSSTNNSLETVIVLIAEIDATGTEGDGTPAIVEHKTGEWVPEYERDLYAVAGWQLVRRLGISTDQIAVHHHHLMRESSPRCVRVPYEASEITEAVSNLRETVERIASWDPLDATQPEPKTQADHECDNCEYRRRCVTFGGPLFPQE